MWPPKAKLRRGVTKIWVGATPAWRTVTETLGGCSPGCDLNVQKPCALAAAASRWAPRREATADPPPCATAAEGPPLAPLPATRLGASAAEVPPCSPMADAAASKAAQPARTRRIERGLIRLN